MVFQSNCIKDLNVRVKTVKLLEENMHTIWHRILGYDTKSMSNNNKYNN